MFVHTLVRYNQHFLYESSASRFLATKVHNNFFHGQVLWDIMLDGNNKEEHTVGPKIFAVDWWPLVWRVHSSDTVIC